MRTAFTTEITEDTENTVVLRLGFMPFPERSPFSVLSVLSVLSVVKAVTFAVEVKREGGRKDGARGGRGRKG